jgi:conjugal transfer pilus assembly protein TraV
MPDAYREVVGGVSSPSPTSGKGRVSSPSTAKNDYDAALYGKLRGLITSPASPIMAPPQVLRVLILPYQDDKRLFMPRYAYVIVDEPRFVMGSYLTEAPQN